MELLMFSLKLLYMIFLAWLLFSKWDVVFGFKWTTWRFLFRVFLLIAFVFGIFLLFV